MGLDGSASQDGEGNADRDTRSLSDRIAVEEKARSEQVRLCEVQGRLGHPRTRTAHGPALAGCPRRKGTRA